MERILIVGGGIAGLSVATALHQHGLAAELVERSPDWPAVGAGIALHANTVRAARALGLGEAIDRAAAPLPRWSFRDERGAPLCETDLEDLWTGVGPCLGITRVELQRILRDGADATPCRLGVAVTRLHEAADHVSAAFSDGSNARYDLVIGADGINSAVRRLAVSPEQPAYAGTMAWRSVVATRPDGVDHLTILLGDGCFFGLVPVGGGTYGFAGVNAERFEDPVQGRLERLRERFAGFGDPVRAYLAALVREEQLHAGPIEWVEPERWHTERVVLVGDAAHAAPPHMVEGGAMAMEDALVLAETLAAGEPLERYADRRRPRTDWVRDQSRIAERAWLLPPAARNAALSERGDQMLRERYRPLIAAP